MRVIAIDIGLTGAIASVDTRGYSRIDDMPTLLAEEASKQAKRRIDGHALAQILRQHVPVDDTAMVLMEDVQARPFGRQNGAQHGNSMQSQGSLMRSRGVVEGVADCLRLKITVVQPQTWKRFFDLIGKEKDAARSKAMLLYPDCAGQLARKKDINRADALLIAHWGVRLLT
tara:strand:+ start:365 stop:880 length:516 start_codon:yes stop_codon:yes gene_type:complete